MTRPSNLGACRDYLLKKTDIKKNCIARSDNQKRDRRSDDQAFYPSWLVLAASLKDERYHVGKLKESKKRIDKKNKTSLILPLTTRKERCYAGEQRNGE